MQLFNDQIEFSGNIIEKLKTKRKVVGQLATGGGKTNIFSDLCIRYTEKYRHNSALIFVHREELLNQTRRTLYDWGKESVFPIVAGVKYIPPADVYVGMVESTFKRLHNISKPPGLIIVDECHNGSFNKIQGEFPEAKFIGFTATPLATSKKQPLNSFYEDIVCGPSIQELIRMGRLCQNVTYAPKEIVSRLELKMAGGDFDERIMGNQFSRTKYVYNTVEAYRRWCEGEKTIVFNCNTSHNKIVHEAFLNAGFKSRMLDSENTPKEERSEVLQWFKNTPDAVLNNVGIATMGFDEPSIINVIYNRATASMPNWIQAGGRGARVLPWKHLFRIIDMGGNAITHGDWSQNRDWQDIFYNPVKPGKGGVPPYKNCVHCEAIIYASATICPICLQLQPRSSAALEQAMSEFVMVTKNIDVHELTQQHKNKRAYYTMFLLAQTMAQEAYKSAGEVNEEIANFTLLSYNVFAKQYVKSIGKSWNEWHRNKAKEILFEELKKLDDRW